MRNTQSLYLRLDDAIGWLDRRAEYHLTYYDPDIVSIRYQLKQHANERSGLISYNKAGQILNQHESDKLSVRINRVIAALRNDWRQAKFHCDTPWV